MARRTFRGRTVVVASIVALGAAAGALLALRAEVGRALDPPLQSSRPVRWSPLPRGRGEEWYGAARVTGVALGVGDRGGLVVAGGFGVWEQQDGGEGRYLRDGLPTLGASAVTRWRGRLVVALASGGIYLRDGGGWQELIGGYGRLHARALTESPAGELLAGCAEGLFRLAPGASMLERLHDRPVRAIAVDATRIVSGGEQGLDVREGGRVTRRAVEDPWVEAVDLDGDRLHVVTLRGLASGLVSDGALAPARGGADLVAGAASGGDYFGIAATPAPSLRRLHRDGRVSEERLPGVPSRVLRVAGELFAATDRGLFRRGQAGWELVRVPRGSELPGGAHVGALAAWRRGIALGLFDGGLVLGEPEGDGTAFHPAPGAGVSEDEAGSRVWGVNALCPVAGELWIASLRGAARWDGERITPVEGPGAAFSLARTDEGVAIGYAQGVRVPGRGLVSAFHGLPGNQATALAAGGGGRGLLFVGTPSGLGALARTRVAWRVTPGQDQLPHAWVTSLALDGDDLWIGTYGGGIARRAPGAGAVAPLVETAGKKITCLLASGGLLWAGTEGDGLWRARPGAAAGSRSAPPGAAAGSRSAPPGRDGIRFERQELPLPSPVVTALVAHQGTLWVGTSEGLARFSVAVTSVASAARSAR